VQLSQREDAVVSEAEAEEARGQQAAVQLLQLVAVQPQATQGSQRGEDGQAAKTRVGQSEAAAASDRQRGGSSGQR
jgi:hypothetical protein